ncbi:hypothetical protein B0H17DRAFT_1201371 [Mycena rosella]|uniref:Uncharacterized protein n=1 Tax=Mycena rosella TaxID=1033263 RepID=A0AAD7DGH4_MYCRO|nr:hypothetical protein B0H17DRAFT_1201371 [Mycena rosella]
MRSILNCAVIGTDTHPYFHVVTRADFCPEQTVFHTNGGRDVAAVEWVADGGGAYIELHEKTLEKRLVHSICLYHWNSEAPEDVPELLAKIAKENDTVMLDIAATAIKVGLLKMCVICVVLFQSGCHID